MEEPELTYSTISNPLRCSIASVDGMRKTRGQWSYHTVRLGGAEYLARSIDGYINISKRLRDISPNNKRPLTFGSWSATLEGRVLLDAASRALRMSVSELSRRHASDGPAYNGTYIHPLLLPMIEAWLMPDVCVSMANVYLTTMVGSSSIQLEEERRPPAKMVSQSVNNAVISGLMEGSPWSPHPYNKPRPYQKIATLSVRKLSGEGMYGVVPRGGDPNRVKAPFESYEVFPINKTLSKTFRGLTCNRPRKVWPIIRQELLSKKIIREQSRRVPGLDQQSTIFELGEAIDETILVNALEDICSRLDWSRQDEEEEDTFTLIPHCVYKSPRGLPRLLPARAPQQYTDTGLTKKVEVKDYKVYDDPGRSEEEPETDESTDVSGEVVTVASAAPSPSVPVDRPLPTPAQLFAKVLPESDEESSVEEESSSRSSSGRSSQRQKD